MVLLKSDVLLYLFGYLVFWLCYIYYGDDEDWRFILFVNGAVEFCWNGWKLEIVYCNDWYIGMILVWMYEILDIKIVFIIYNLVY